MATVSSTSISSTSTLTADSTPQSGLKAPELPARPSLVPAQWDTGVRTVGLHEIREAGLSLALAFATEGLSRYLVEDDGQHKTKSAAAKTKSAEETDLAKWRLHVDIMTYNVAAVVRNGFVTTTGPDYDAIALWLPPRQNIDDWWTILRSGMWRLYFQLPAEGRIRHYDELLPLLHHTKQEVLGDRDDDSYYLLYLGTKPASRGRGCARRLIEPMCARADREGRALYLESSSLANNAYYGKFGFRRIKDIALVRGAAPIPLTIMVREPVTAKTAAAGVEVETVEETVATTPVRN